MEAQDSGGSGGQKRKLSTDNELETRIVSLERVAEEMKTQRATLQTKLDNLSRRIESLEKAQGKQGQEVQQERPKQGKEGPERTPGSKNRRWLSGSRSVRGSPRNSPRSKGPL